MVFVERHYLSTYGGGFTENFYGLKRERVLSVKGGELRRTQLVAPIPLRQSLKLSQSDVWKNVAVMVGLPYLKRRLDEAHEIYVPQSTLLGPRYNRDTLLSDATLRQRLLHYYKWFLRNIYPSLNAAYYFSMILFNLAYLFDSTAYSSPFFWLIQTRIRCMSSEDYRAIDLAQQKPPKPATLVLRPGQPTSIFSPQIVNKIILPKVFSGLKLALPTSIFLLKFLEWWHASDFARQLSRKATEGLDLPPPIISELQQKVIKPNETISTTKNSVSLGTPANTAQSPSPSPSSTITTATAQTPTTTTKPNNQNPNQPKPKSKPPISSTTHLPILTVPRPNPSTTNQCPICQQAITTPTAAQTGHVFCYTCIFRWISGTHERQLSWMDSGNNNNRPNNRNIHNNGINDIASERGEEIWRDNIIAYTADDDNVMGPREGAWDDGRGRCPITGRRLLGGVEGLRRVIT